MDMHTSNLEVPEDGPITIHDKEDDKSDGSKVEELREGEQSPAAPETVRPSFVHPCPRHGTHLASRSAIYEEAGERIKVTVGRENNKMFIVHKRLLRYFAKYFEGALRGDCFGDAKSGEFVLPDDDPEEFHRWVLWLYSCFTCKQAPVYHHSHKCEESTWYWPEADVGLIFADRILSAEYSVFALGHFI
ncbi:hypothetical protein B0H66DRAFT_599631 [Apodospora peruviana]|uniref:BTB domain-containing protein n=1 Tax=Apodospora peruviana TaxID=516989 RepID=A0AAE0MBD4_9PEZI|nr:hypothetical protein B0H66DRAFT_599631 [Apodospora peruviana]